MTNVLLQQVWLREQKRAEQIFDVQFSPAEWPLASAPGIWGFLELVSTKQCSVFIYD